MAKVFISMNPDQASDRCDSGRLVDLLMQASYTKTVPVSQPEASATASRPLPDFSSRSGNKMRSARVRGNWSYEDSTTRSSKKKKQKVSKEHHRDRYWGPMERYCVLDAEGEVIRRDVSGQTRGLAKHFEGIAAVRIAIENGTHSIWINEQLRGHEYCGNVRELHAICRNDRKGDKGGRREARAVCRLDPNVYGRLLTAVWLVSSR